MANHRLGDIDSSVRAEGQTESCQMRKNRDRNNAQRTEKDTEKRITLNETSQRR